MNKLQTLAAAACAFLAIAATPSSYAGVTPEEAAKLKTTLTPLGAERAANKDGSIPAWDGGLTKSAGKTSTGMPNDPFPEEKPLFRITPQNAAQYADKLSEGTAALLKKYPSFGVEVFKTHRTAAAPNFVYENTMKNATRGKLTHEGLSVEGVYGGIPFPIPKNGQEVIWNHILHPRPMGTEIGFKNVVGSADGRYALASRADNNQQFPYYFKDGSVEKWSGDYILARLLNTDPPFKAGEALVVRDNVNPDNARQAWQYLVGQRRVRRAPTVGYDTPDFVASGANYFDEVVGFWGHPDRYEWKLVGKKEMYIPYNENRFFASNVSEAFVPYHANPDKVRWELHRVWVVDATLASGKRHAVPKRRFYFDEDTWAVSMIDGYDAEGKLWRASLVLPFAYPEYPVSVFDSTLVYNLQANTFSCIQCFIGEYWRAVAPKSDSYWTGDSLGSSGTR